MPFEFKKLEIPEIILITPKVFHDERGFFLESYKKSDFEKYEIPELIQENHSFSKKGVLRGLHYQKEPKAQGKLVRVIKGNILDIVVDIRKKSKTYGKYLIIELSENNKNLLWVPKGFAHGFLALEDSEVIYKTSNEYSPEHERGIIYNDPALNILLPELNLIVHERDLSYTTLDKADNYF
ncbi:dTDP-4-dehydrorhamnose 3,5-epimerase [Candidatus Woesearchaeota archaeon]|nr:dTDP-4-dehydrorhamnose 3,5-epimerase [Candidatus Woesearchaeota archaeon]